MYPAQKDGRPDDEMEGLRWLHSFVSMPATRGDAPDTAQELARIKPIHEELQRWLPKGAYIWFDEAACDIVQAKLDKKELIEPAEGFPPCAWTVFAKPLWMTDEDKAQTRWALHSVGHAFGAISLHGMRSETTPPSIDYCQWQEHFWPTFEHNKMWSAAALQLIAFCTAIASTEVELKGVRWAPELMRPTVNSYRKAGISMTLPDLGMVCFSPGIFAVDGEAQQ